MRRLLWTAAAVTVLAACMGTRWFLRRPKPPASHVPSPEARRLFEMANFGTNPSRTEVRTGIKYCPEAIRLDPRFAQPWVGLASAHRDLAWFGEVPASDAMPGPEWRRRLLQFSLRHE